MDLSVIVVSYNTESLLIQTLESVRFAGEACDLEVYVVDNGSTDNSVQSVRELFPEVTLICNDKNVGFATANNQAIRQSAGRYVLLLNSDTVVRHDTFRVMIDFLDTNSTVGAAGCKVVKPDGQLDLACRRSFPTVTNAIYHFLRLDKLFPHSERFARYNLTFLDPDLSYQVDSLVGAFMMVRREAIVQAGLLDEAFFMYGEDIDWCYRIKDSGWQIWYVASTSIVHLKGGSGRRRVKVSYEFYRAMLVYFKKHHASNSAPLAVFFVLGGIRVLLGLVVLRIIISDFIGRSADLVGRRNQQLNGDDGRTSKTA